MPYGPPAVLYTAQTLTPTQVQQIQDNFNGTTGLPGFLKFGGDQVSGLQFLNAGNNVSAQLTNDLDHGGANLDELKLTYGKTLYIAPNDPTTASFAVQDGPALGGAGGGFWYTPPDGDVTNNGDVQPSQYKLLTALYKAAGTKTYVAIKSQVVTDASGNATLFFTAHSSGGYTTASASVRVPSGSLTHPGLSCGSATMGMGSTDATHLQLQGGTDGLGSILNLGGGYILTGAADRMRVGYVDDAAANAFQIYYPGVGASVVSGSEWYFSTNATKTLSLITNGLRVDSGSIALKSFTVGTLPSASTHTAGAIVYVSDAAVAPLPAFSNGTVWKRFDNAATTVI